MPFDLKVTYFPEGYMLAKRKSLGLPSEMQLLKGFAKSQGIVYDKKQKEKTIFSELITRISERKDETSRNFITEFQKSRWQIVQDTIKDSKHLMQWLYEEQGERRFDAANRLFLVLIDKNNMEDSWKMKRNVDLLTDEVQAYLDKFNAKDVSKLEIEFDWMDGKKYKTVCDVIFVIK